LQTRSEPTQRALVVDDEKDITYLVKFFFERLDKNLKVETYNDPLRALQNFRKGIYDFILLDVKMTPISGIELYKRIREIDEKVKVFVFTVTNPEFEEFKKICSSFEEKYFIRKPISFQNLFQYIRSTVA
jgi:CheY-like chemotaxis protein